MIVVQGKSPDWVLEMASEDTGHADVAEKREFYESLRIREDWRTGHTLDGEWHGARLTGDRLLDGQFETVPI